MKRSLTLFGIAAFLAASAAWADDASRMAKADELLRITKGDQSYKQMIERAEANIKTQAVRQTPEDADKAAIEQKVSQILSEQMNWDKLRSQVVKAYADAFTEEELDGILAFYKSPAGQAWSAKLTDVNLKAVKISQQALQDAQSQIRKTIQQAAPKEQ